jgi:hypothetical protein
MALRHVPEELLAQSFDDDSDYRRPPDARRAMRRHVLVPIRFWIPGESEPRRAALRNLSEDGAFVEHDPIPVRTLLRIELRRGDEVVIREAEVVWCERGENATHVRYVRGFGVRFLAAKSAVE